MNAQMQALKPPNQITTLTKNMTMIMPTTILTTEKEMTWMIWGVGVVGVMTEAVVRLFESF